ncbi:MAG TPA: hypothetical protein VFW23_12955 [Tepidisphaeraceae bacterium]|nr:hypothetical protein [Tepidisphaeraceae bacterium]
MNTQSPPPSSARIDPRTDSTDPPPRDGEPAEQFKFAVNRLAELREYALYFVSAKLDGIKLSLRNAVIYAGLGIVGALAGGAVIAVAAALLVIGAAHGIGAALGGHAWLGDLIIGVLVLAVVGIGAVMAVKWLTKSFHQQLVNKYQSRQQEQRRTYGHDVQQRADEQRSSNVR